MAHLRLSSDPSEVTDADVIPFGANSPDPPSSVSKSGDPPGPPQGIPPGPPGTGHVTFYTIPYGRDGWTVSNFNGQTAYVGPVTGSDFATAIAPPIEGTDLTAITSIKPNVYCVFHSNNTLFSREESRSYIKLSG